MNLYRRLERVWQLEGIRPHQRLVLINLAWRADERSLTCFPSAGRIAADTGMTRPGVQKVIAELARVGLITVMSSGRGKGRNAPNQYRLNCLEMDFPVGHLDAGEWIPVGKRMDNHKPVNGSPGWHEPLNHKETIAARPGDGAPAPGARAPRRPRPPELGESREAKGRRQLLEVAELKGWHQMNGESDYEYYSRLRRLNDVRVAGLK